MALKPKTQKEAGQEYLTRRIKLFSVTPELLMLMGSGKFEVIANSLPEDAQRVGAFYDAGRDCFTIVISSAEFEEVSVDQDAPHHEPPWIRRLEWAQ